MGIKTINDVQPKAVMTPEELARWNELPADEQLARLRAAIKRGVDSGDRRNHGSDLGENPRPSP